MIAWLALILAMSANAANRQFSCRVYKSIPIYETKPNCEFLDRGILISYNKVGLRESEPPENPERKFTILLVGGQEIASEYLPLRNSFAKVLEAELNGMAERKIRVINATFESYRPLDSLMTAENAIKAYKPDLVLFYLGHKMQFFRTSAYGRMAPRKSLHPVELDLPVRTENFSFSSRNAHKWARRTIYQMGLAKTLWPWIKGSPDAAEQTLAPLIDVLKDMRTISNDREARFAVLYEGYPPTFSPWAAEGPVGNLFWLQQVISPAWTEIALDPDLIDVQFRKADLDLITTSELRGKKFAEHERFPSVAKELAPQILNFL